MNTKKDYSGVQLDLFEHPAEVEYILRALDYLHQVETEIRDRDLLHPSYDHIEWLETLSNLCTGLEKILRDVQSTPVNGPGSYLNQEVHLNQT